MISPFKQFFLKHSRIIIPSWFILLKDTLVILFSFSFAYTLRYNFQLDDDALYAMYFQMALMCIYAPVVFYFLGLHKGLIRHTGLRDGILIIKAVFFITCLILVMNVLVNINFVSGIYRVPHSIIIIFFTLASTLIVLIRGAVRLFYNWLKAEGNVTRVLIYGAGAAGLITKNVLHADRSRNTQVVGFIDDNAGIIGKTIEGIYVFSSNVLNPKFLSEKGVKEIIFAINKIEKQRKSEIIESLLLQTHLQVKEIPPVDAWINGELSVKQISSIKIADLLQRSEIILNNDHVEKQLDEKRIMVTGAAGSIGSEIVRQLLRFTPSLIIMVDQDETAMFNLENEVKEKLQAFSMAYPNLIPVGVEFIIANVGDPQLMSRVFSEFKPQVIYHAAAYKHVPMMERNPFEAVRVNVFGTKNLADLAVANGTERFVMVSTDKAVNPTNVMGATKRAAEIYIQSLNNHLHTNKLRRVYHDDDLLHLQSQAESPADRETQPDALHQANYTEFITTRFGNVLGSNGSVIPLFEKQIARGGPVTVTHPEITRYFMTIPEACQLVLEAGAIGNGGEILMFDMGKPVKIADLAYNMIRLSGMEPNKDIPIVYTGLRPGEKLYEELLYDKEKGIKTHHPKISIASVKPYPFNQVNRYLDSMNAIAGAGTQAIVASSIISGIDFSSNRMQLIAALKIMIPEYISNNSIYQELDIPAELTG